MRSEIAKRILESTSDDVRREVRDYANKMVNIETGYNTSIVPIEYFEANRDFAKKVLDEYNDAKEKNCSWFGPKIPFYITRPKLISNAHAAMKALKKKSHGGKRKGAGRPVTKEPTIVMRIPISKVEAVKKLIKKSATPLRNVKLPK